MARFAHLGEIYITLFCTLNLLTAVKILINYHSTRSRAAAAPAQRSRDRVFRPTHHPLRHTRTYSYMPTLSAPPSLAELTRRFTRGPCVLFTCTLSWNARPRLNLDVDETRDTISEQLARDSSPNSQLGSELRSKRRNLPH